jgi:hypothetical protein
VRLDHARKMMRPTITPIALVAIACISTPASAGWNGLDWAILLNGLTRPAPVVVVQPVPVVMPLAISYTPNSNVGSSGTPSAVTTECEEKPYIQYKDELHVFGDKATIAQMCRIKLGTTPACGRELTKITLALHAADINTVDCSFLLGVAVGMTPDQVKGSKVGNPLETKTLRIAGKVTDQWKFDGFSVYFENGVVSAIQQY